MTPEQQQLLTDAVTNLNDQAVGTSDYKAHLRNVSGIIYGGNLAENEAAKTLLAENGLEMEKVSKVLPLTFEQEDAIIKRGIKGSVDYAAKDAVRAAGALLPTIDAATVDYLRQDLTNDLERDSGLKEKFETFAGLASTSSLNEKNSDEHKALKAAAVPIIQALHTTERMNSDSELIKIKEGIRVQFDASMGICPEKGNIPAINNIYMAGASDPKRDEMRDKLSAGTTLAGDAPANDLLNNLFNKQGYVFIFDFPKSHETSNIKNSLIDAFVGDKDKAHKQAFPFMRPGAAHVCPDTGIKNVLPEQIPGLVLLNGSGLALTPGQTETNERCIGNLAKQAEEGKTAVFMAAINPEEVEAGDKRAGAVGVILYHRDIAEATKHMVLIEGETIGQGSPKVSAATNEQGQFVVIDKEAYSAWVKSAAKELGQVKLGDGDKQTYADVLAFAFKSEKGADDINSEALKSWLPSDVKADKELYANVLVSAFSENGAVDKVGLQTWMNTHRDTSVTKAEGAVQEKADIGFSDRFQARARQAVECCVSDGAAR